MAEQALVPGKLYTLKMGAQTVPGKVVEILYRVDVNTLEQVPAQDIPLNGIAEVVLQLDAPAAFDRYEDSRLTGAFILIDRLTNVTVGAGMVASAIQRQTNTSPVSAEERAARLGQKPAVIAVAAALFGQELERALLEQGIVALCVTDLSQLPLLRTTGLVLLIIDPAQADVAVEAPSLDALTETIAARVQL
jgi:sulfate adenylyltransferase subunit 1